MKKPKLFLICTGLGLVQRGFETYIAELGEKLLADNQSFTTTVYSGGFYQSTNLNSKKLFCIPRNSYLCKKFLGIEITSEIEQISFFFSLIAQILVNSPKAIYLGEYKLYCYLFKYRSFFKLKYSLILYTGGQVSPGLFDPKKDYVHHVTDIYYNNLILEGYPFDRQFVLPHFIADIKIVQAEPRKLAAYNTKNKKIVISVGLIDKSIKKMDQFVRALAQDPSKYFPVILGEYTADTPEIENTLEQNFGSSNYLVRKVSREELFVYLNEADLFMLLSPKESFGLAALEAMFVGLPVITCDYYESRYVLKDKAIFVNCADAYSISELVNSFFLKPQLESAKQARIEFVKNNYSWNKLGFKYIEMFHSVINE